MTLTALTMKAFAALVSGAILASKGTDGFSPIVHTPTISHSSTLLRAAELKPEPEGGEELTKMSSSLPDSRMKNMGADDEDDVYNFWLSATASGAKVKKLRAQTEREAGKKANFPGFRKVSCHGQVPDTSRIIIVSLCCQIKTAFSNR